MSGHDPAVAATGGDLPPDRYRPLAERLGGRLLSVQAPTGGVSARTLLLTMAVGDQARRVVVRGLSGLVAKSQQAESLSQQHDLLTVLHGQELPVPEPVLADAYGVLTGEPILVLRHLDGTTAHPPLGEAVPAMGALLASVHQAETARLTTLGLPTVDDPSTEARQALEPARARYPGRFPDRAVSSQPIDELRLDLWSVRSSAGMLVQAQTWGLTPGREHAVERAAGHVLDAALARLARPQQR